MRHMRFEDSEILQEFARKMKEGEELKKMAQVVQPSPLEAYSKYLGMLQQKAQTPNPTHDPNLLIGKAQLQKLMDLGRAVGGDVAKEAMEPMQEYDAGRNPKPVLLKLQPHLPTAGIYPITKELGNPVPPSIEKEQSVEGQNTKTAEQKAYDVTPKENIIHDAHPKSAIVSGDVIENVEEAQKIDLEVVNKEPSGKTADMVLTELYKLAKQLKAEKNDEAYKLVKEAFLDIAKDVKANK